MERRNGAERNFGRNSGAGRLFMGKSLALNLALVLNQNGYEQDQKQESGHFERDASNFKQLKSAKGEIMKPIIYRTRLGQAKSVPLPDDIRHLLDKDADIEVTIRKIRPKHDDMRTTDQVLGEIQEKMDKDFPNLRKPFDPELSAIAGISGDMEEAVSKYGGREIMGMARIEKYLEKGETIETLS